MSGMDFTASKGNMSVSWHMKRDTVKITSNGFPKPESGPSPFITLDFDQYRHNHDDDGHFLDCTMDQVAFYFSREQATNIVELLTKSLEETAPTAVHALDNGHGSY